MKKFLQIAASVAILGGVLLVAPSRATAAAAPTYDWYVSQNYRTLDFGNGRSCSYADDDNIQDVLDEIDFDDSVYICPGTWTGDGLMVSTFVRIFGAGRDITILDGGYASGCNGDGAPILQTSGSQVIVRNITFRNGCSDDEYFYDGGAINSSGGTVVCIDSAFEDNYAADAGGAIYGSYVESTRCTFERNYADSDDGSNGGGAVYASMDFYAFKSMFAGNGAANTGGAVYVANYYTVKTSTFVDNYADDGAAIFGEGDQSGTVSNSRFVTNHADDTGGAITHNGTAYLWVSGATFLNNDVCTAFGPCDYAWGGAIYSVGDLTVIRSTFTGNVTSSGVGAAITMYDVTDPDLTLNNVVFKGNSGLSIVEWSCGGSYVATRVRFIANSYLDEVGCY